jgi:hypothetical protein
MNLHATCLGQYWFLSWMKENQTATYFLRSRLFTYDIMKNCNCKIFLWIFKSKFQTRHEHCFLTSLKRKTWWWCFVICKLPLQNSFHQKQHLQDTKNCRSSVDTLVCVHLLILVDQFCIMFYPCPSVFPSVMFGSHKPIYTLYLFIYTVFFLCSLFWKSNMKPLALKQQTLKQQNCI